MKRELAQINDELEALEKAPSTTVQDYRNMKKR